MNSLEHVRKRFELRNARKNAKPKCFVEEKETGTPTRHSVSFRYLVPILIVPILVLMTGCATILEGSKQTIRLHCEPSNGLKVIVDGKETEFVNGDIQLDKKRVTHFVTFEKEHYYPNTISFNREINPFWVVADLLWGPAVPLAWIVDWQTGSFYRIDPRDLHVALRQQE